METLSADACDWWKLSALMLVIDGHVDVVGVAGAVGLAAQVAVVAGLQVRRRVPPLNMVVDVGGLGHKVANAALPAASPYVLHLAANCRVRRIYRARGMNKMLG